MPIIAEMDTCKSALSAKSAALKATLENSRALASALDRTGQKLDRIGQSLPGLEAAARPFPAQKCTFAAISDHVDRAVGPAAAVLKVHGAIQELRKSVLGDPSLDLYAYLSSMKQLEEALKFLANNCGLAIQWMQDILQFLEDNSVANEPYICNVKKSLRILLELEATEKRARIDGGVLLGAFTKLEMEYKQLLVANSVPVPLAICSSSLVGKKTIDAASIAIPVNVVERLQAINERLRANNRLSWCTSAYIDVRVANIKTSLQGIDLSYLDKPIIGDDDVQELEGWIDQWSNHLELIVKSIFEVEFNLSRDVFCSTPDVSISCFTEIATRSGILSFLKFGRKVTECKKDAIKLLKLLDIFTALDNLRGDFNRLFGGTSCLGIRNQTRSLIKSVVDGACEIFLELTDEVSQQREVYTPSNGCVPRLVSFVTEYCNELLGDKYRPLLEKVLMIHQSWKEEKYEDELLTSQICRVLREIGLNLDSWSNAHVDSSLSYLFMMNNHCHFSNLRGTKLGDLMGDSWLKAHEQYKDHFVALYLRESWGKVISHLRPEGQVYSSPAKVSTKGLKAFNQALDNMYKKQSSWVVPDENLRLRICKLLVQSLVPVYRGYLQSYKLLTEQDHSAEKHVKYTTQRLETMLSSLFQHKMTKYRHNRHAYWISKIKDVMSDHFRPTLMAA